MGTKNKVLSQDGKYYDSIEEAVAATYVYKEQKGIQEEQNRLIEKQNRLIEEQNRINAQLEYDKMQNDYNIEMKKLNHAEKMRLYKLFDDVGISKNIYDEYINKCLNLKKVLSTMRVVKYFNFLLNPLDYSTEEYGKLYEEYSDLNYLEEQIDQKCMLKCDATEIEKYNKVKKINDALELVWGFGIIICFIGFILSAFLSTEIIDSLVPFFIWLGYLVIFIIFSIIVKIVKSKFPESKEPKSTIDYDKRNKLLEQAKLKAEKDYSKELEPIRTAIEEFTNFRINHYNKDIEKLLVDCEYKALVEGLGIKYQIVNVNNKKKNGKVEDYTAFFEEHI